MRPVAAAQSKKPKPLRPLTTGDLFAGAGGLSVGFHLAGFTPAFFNEIDESAARTFTTNFPSATPFVCPIQDLSTRDIERATGLDGGDIDVMMGGPPCQGYSINAPIRSIDDPRNHLFRHYVRLVLEGLRPKIVILENVTGLVSFEGGRTLHDVKAAFEQAGYRVIFRILNAAHYGVPQERWRFVMLATRLPNVELSFPMPFHYSLQRPNFTGGKEHIFRFATGRPEQDSLLDGGLRAPVNVREAIGDLPPIASGGGTQQTQYPFPPQSAYQESLRRGSEFIWNHECAGANSINLSRMEYVPPGGSWRDIPHDMLPKGMQRARRSDHTKRYGRLDPDGLSGTILTKCDPHWGTVFHYDQNRIISVREAARFQSFPDWFRFTGSKVEQYRQVGNAVPCLLAFVLAQHVRQLLDSAIEVAEENLSAAS